MTTKLIIAVLFSLCFYSSVSAQNPLKSPAHIGLIYPLSTNGVHAAEYTNGMSMHAIAGVSYAEQAFCASGVANIIKSDAKGLIASGFANVVLNRSKGLMAAGFMNYNKNDMMGVHAAGFLNYTGNGEGLQAGGFANVSKNNFRGAQFAGFINVSENVNVQGAGFANMAKDVEGLQFAGFINKSKNVNTQVAGFINIAKEVKGVQLAGFINIADSSDYPIGVVNIIKKGEKSLGLMIDEDLTTMATFRSGGRVMYGIVGAGVNFKDGGDPLFAMEAGIGAHINISKSFRLNIEGTGTSYTDTDLETYFRSSLRLLPTLHLGKAMDIYAGPSLSYIVYDGGNSTRLGENYVWTEKAWDYVHRLYFGGVAGIQFHL